MLQAAWLRRGFHGLAAIVLYFIHIQHRASVTVSTVTSLS